MNNEMVKQIEKAKNIAIFIHVSPDGDCLGTAIALSYALKDLGKNVKIFSSDKVGQEFNFDKEEMKKISNAKCNPKKYDLFISVDVPSLARLGKNEVVYSSFNNTIEIDHHISNTKFAKNNYVYIMPSCGEVLYQLLKTNKITISPKIATYLYMAVISDTGCLQVLSATENTYKVLYELVASGAEQYRILTGLFRSVSPVQIEKEKILYESIVYFGKGTCYAIFNRDTTDKFKVLQISPLVEKMARIENVKYCFCLKDVDEENNIRGTIRSVGDIDCSYVAKEFGGGGHKNASGFETKGDLNDILQKVLRLSKKIIK